MYFTVFAFGLVFKRGYWATVLLGVTQLPDCQFKRCLRACVTSVVIYSNVVIYIRYPRNRRLQRLVHIRKQS